MNITQTMKKERFSGYRILILAIFFSFAWHLFWLSMIKVVAPSPARSSQVKYSRVSFLGQILAKVNMEVRAQPAQRSLLERRYNLLAGRIGHGSEGTLSSLAIKPEAGSGVNRDADATMLYLISDAVSGTKAEPEYGSE